MLTQQQLIDQIFGGAAPTGAEAPRQAAREINPMPPTDARHAVRDANQSPLPGGGVRVSDVPRPDAQSLASNSINQMEDRARLMELILRGLGSPQAMPQ